MSTIPFVGDGGPDATISKIGGATATGVIQPPQSSIDFTGLNPGSTHATRHIVMMVVGTGASQCTGMKWNGNDCDFFDKFGSVAIGSKADSSSTSLGTYTALFSPSFAQNLVFWAFRTTNLLRPTRIHDFQDGSLVGANGTWSIDIDTRRGGILLGGLTGTVSVSGSVSVSGISNKEENVDSTNRRWAMWDTTAATVNNKSVSITQSGPTNGTMFGSLWAFR